MFTPQLTKSEKRIIKKIAQLQIRGITALITGTYGGDILSYCLELGITEEQIMELAKENRRIFYNVYNNPHLFLDLDEDNLSITRHLLFTGFKLPKYQKAKIKIINKLRIKEHFTNSLN